MISGFLGTLISLERALALAAIARSRLPYAAPLLAGLGALALVLGLPAPVGQGLLLAGSLGLAAIFIDINRRQLNWPHAVMGLGALAWVGGNTLWLLGRPVYAAMPGWVAFLVLTIAGERLELAQLRRPGRMARLLFVGAVALVGAGLALTLGPLALGLRVMGLGLALLGAWLSIYDLARRTVRQTGLPRFVALCLLPGYGWLIVGGALWGVWADRFGGGPWYDASLHTILIGFVISMVFGHAPIILPAITGRALPYRPRFYLHLGLLHGALLLRVAGDGLGQLPLRQWGGLLNEVAIMLFMISSAAAVIGAARAHASAPQSHAIQR
jgi:hypothetical protein